jgi:DNA-binding NarL/FixJ family response regulator
VNASVLLVDDDRLIGQYVALALESLPLHLAVETTLAGGRRALRESPPDLLLTDLSLPDGDGLALLQAGAFALPRTIVCSADVTPETRRRAMQLGAWRVLDKPVAVRTLRDCVCQALDLRAEPVKAADGDAPAPDLGTGISAAFAGRPELHAEFRRASLVQFGHDIASGDAALLAGDQEALRRLAHSLKGVLGLLGEDEAAGLARRLDAAAAQAHPEAAALWASLREHLAAAASHRAARG